MDTIAEQVAHTYNICRTRFSTSEAIEAVHRYAQRICTECSDIGCGGDSDWIYKFEDGSVLSVPGNKLLVL